MKWIGGVLGVSHLLAVLTLGYMIANSTDGNAVMAWLFFLSVDFPVGFGLVPLGYLVTWINPLSAIDTAGHYSIYRDVSNFWLPLCYFGVIGSLWWYFWPQWAATLIRKLLSGFSRFRVREP